MARILNEYVSRRLGILELQTELQKLIADYNKHTGRYMFIYAADINKARNRGIDVSLVQDDFYNIQDILRQSDKKKIEGWFGRVNSISAKYGYSVRDMDATDDYYCNSFVDGGHIAKDCYHPFMRYVMSEYFKLK